MLYLRHYLLRLSSETDKITKNFRQVVEEHDEFRQEVRAELEKLRNLFQTNQTNQATSTTLPTQIAVAMSPGSTLPLPSVTLSSTTLPDPVILNSSSQDIQTQMMILMTESFSKLSAVFLEGKHDTKSEWPKFNGDAKRFRSWYLGVLTQLSLPPWQELYNSVTHDVVQDTQNATLNGKLYPKVLLALEGSAYKNFVSRKHLRANGVLLLQELVQT
jgi:hypothetical protein